MSNNGYEVVNIGIKQPIATILDVALDKKADVIGMSGLLVKSTGGHEGQPQGTQRTRSRREVPGSARWCGAHALLRFENDLQEVYEGDVSYARDAFEGLNLMDQIMTTKRGGGPAPDSPEAHRCSREGCRA